MTKTNRRRFMAATTGLSTIITGEAIPATAEGVRCTRDPSQEFATAQAYYDWLVEIEAEVMRQMSRAERRKRGRTRV